MSEMSFSEFRVELAQLREAIGAVGREAQLIDTYMSTIAIRFLQVKDVWTSPAELTFEDVQQWFTRVQEALRQLLEETVRRMQAAYDNYHATELRNVNNLR